MKHRLLTLMALFITLGAVNATAETYYTKGSKTTTIESGKKYIIEGKFNGSTGHLWYSGANKNTWNDRANYRFHSTAHSIYDQNHVWTFTGTAESFTLQSVSGKDFPTGYHQTVYAAAAQMKLHALAETSYSAQGDYTISVTNGATSQDNFNNGTYEEFYLHSDQYSAITDASGGFSVSYWGDTTTPGTGSQGAFCFYEVAEVEVDPIEITSGASYFFKAKGTEAYLSLAGTIKGDNETDNSVTIQTTKTSLVLTTSGSGYTVGDGNGNYACIHSGDKYTWDACVSSSHTATAWTIEPVLVDDTLCYKLKCSSGYLGSTSDNGWTTANTKMYTDKSAENCIALFSIELDYNATLQAEVSACQTLCDTKTLGKPYDADGTFQAAITAAKAKVDAGTATAADLTTLLAAKSAYQAAQTTDTKLYLPTGYYTMKNLNTDSRPAYVFNAFQFTGNSNDYTLQSSTQVTDNSGLWHVVNNGDNITITNGQGQGLNTDKGKYTTLNFVAANGTDGFAFTQHPNASKSGRQITQDEVTYNYLTAWTDGGANAMDNRWTFEAVSVDNIYKVSFASNCSGYVTYSESQYAKDGGFFNISGTPQTSDFAATLTDGATATITIDTESKTISVSSAQADLLDAMFTDKSYSEFTDAYKAKTLEEITTAVASLSEETRTMILNVKNGWSTEEEASNTSSDFVDKFRVREYKAYSDASLWRGKLSAIQLGNNTNPTGIISNEGDKLKVYVKDEVPANCELYMLDMGFCEREVNCRSRRIALHQGENEVTCTGDKRQWWVCYQVVKTTVKPADIPAMKIHIEGGTVIGFADMTDLGEEAANQEYKSVFQNTEKVATAKSLDGDAIYFITKGDYGVFNFTINCYKQVWAGTKLNESYDYDPDYKMYKSIHFYDQLMKWEWSTMGIMKRVKDNPKGQALDPHEYLSGGEDIYPTYCNNLALTIQGNGGSNPFATTDYTFMPGIGAAESSYNAEREDFDIWCAAHESGHDNQGAINLPSCTESSNNLFSNIVTYLWGYRMSRGNSVADNAQYFADNVPFSSRDISTTMRMYWQLYLYYHVCQHNTSFYPELFKALRKNPLKLYEGTCFTEFYKAACAAAGEDLTDFFKGWGFLSPFENVTFGDYTSYTNTLTQTEIDAAIAVVKAKNYGADTSAKLLFIEDRTELADRWDIWAEEGEKKYRNDGVALTQETLTADYGTAGKLTDMMSGSTTTPTAAASDIVYSLTSSQLTIEGNLGDNGIAVYDAQGNLVAFGAKSPIAVAPELVLTDGIVVKSVDRSGVATAVQSVEEAGTAAQKQELLQAFINEANALLALEDATNTKVGYYRGTYLTDLKTLVNQANTAINNGVSGSYNSLMESIAREVANLKANDDLTIKLVAGNTYSLRNYAYTTRYASTDGASDSQISCPVKSTEIGDTEKWVLESTGTTGYYYVKNVSTGQYVSYIAGSTRAKAAAATTTDACSVSFIDKGEGRWAIDTNMPDVDNRYFHSAANDSYYVVGWNSGAEASQWYLTCEAEGDDGAAYTALQSTVNKTKVLLNSIATTWAGSNEYTLQTTNQSGAFYLSTNAQQSGEGPIENLLDGNTGTYFHSAWSGNNPGTYHNLTIDGADESTFDQFRFYFMMRANAQHSPTKIVISGSNNNSDWTAISTLTSADGLPTSTKDVSSFTSGLLGTAGTKYRYLKFDVQETNTMGKLGNYVYFCMSEFRLRKAWYDAATYTLKDGFSSLSDEAIKNAIVGVCNGELKLNEATTAEKTTFNTTLEGYYTTLKTAIDALEKDPLKTELAALIAETNTLFEAVATGQTYSQAESTPVTLTEGMLSSNHVSTKEGSLAALVDNDTSTYFHSTYEETTSDKHYLQIDLGEGESISRMSFSMKSRIAPINSCPNSITVSVSNDGEDFTDIAVQAIQTVETGTENLRTYASPEYNLNGAYRYVRFTVNSTFASTQYFCLSEFGLNSIGERTYTGTKAAKYTSIDDQLLINVIENMASANEMISDANYASTTANALRYKITTLTGAKEALEAAKAEIDLIDVADKFVASKTLVTSLNQLSGMKIYAIYNVGRKAFEKENDSWKMEQVGNNTDATYIDGQADEGIDFLWQLIKVGNQYKLRNLHTGHVVGGIAENDAQLALYGADATDKHRLFNIGVASAGNNSFYIQDSESSILLNGKGGASTGSGNGYAAVGWGTSTENVDVNSQIQFYEVTLEDAISLTVSAAGYATVCLPYNAEIPGGLSVYTGKYNSASKSVTLTEATDLKAGEGYIVKGAQGTYKFNYTTSEVDTPVNNDLVGVTESTALSNTRNGETGQCYIFSKVNNVIGFYKWSGTSTTLAANKAYLWVSGSVGGVKEFVSISDNDDEATSITNLRQSVPGRAAAIYDLSGRRLGTPQRGINIINGRKVVR